MIFLPKFNVENALKWIPKATSMMGVPTYYTRLLDSAKFNKIYQKIFVYLFQDLHPCLRILTKCLKTNWTLNS